MLLKYSGTPWYQSLSYIYIYIYIYPKHKTINVPYNSAWSICTIVSDENMKEQRLAELQIFLKTHPRRLILAGINKAKEKNQKELQNPIEKTNKK